MFIVEWFITFFTNLCLNPNFLFSCYPFQFPINFAYSQIGPYLILPTSFQSQLHPQLISVPIPNLFCLFPTVPYLIYKSFLNQVQSQHCVHWFIVIWDSTYIKLERNVYIIVYFLYDKWQLANKKRWFKDVLYLFIQKYMKNSFILNIQIADTYLFYPHAIYF